MGDRGIARATWRNAMLSAAVLVVSILASIARPLASAAAVSAAPVHVVRTVVVGDKPVAVAVDSGSGHVFVVNQNGSSVAMLDSRTGLRVHSTAVGVGPVAIAIDSRVGRVFVANRDDSSVSILATRTGHLLRTVRVGPHPEAIATDEATSRVFVANEGVSDDQANGTVTILDAWTGRILTTTASDTSLIHSIAVDERTARVFISNAGSDDISVLDAKNGRLVANVTGADYPEGMAIDEKTNRAFVANESGDSVSVLDARTGAMVTTTPACHAPATSAIDVLAAQVFVACFGDSVNPGGPAAVSVLDGRDGRLLQTLPLPYHVEADAIGVNARTRRVYVACGDQDTYAGSVMVFDLGSKRVVGNVTVGTHPTAIAVDERTGNIFIANQDDGTLTTMQ